MKGAFGKRFKALRVERNIKQGDFARQFEISAAYLSDIERGRRNPPNDEVIIEWTRWLDPGNADQLYWELLELAAKDRKQAEAETEAETEPTSVASSASSAQTRESGIHLSDTTKFLNHFGIDILAEARETNVPAVPSVKLDPADVATVLTRVHRNSTVLTCHSAGDIVPVLYGLAETIASGRATKSLRDIKLVRIDGIQAGVKYRGQFEERLDNILNEAASLQNVVLTFFSVADIVDFEDNARGSMFRSALQTDAIRILAGATPGELDYCRKQNPGIIDLFNEIPLEPFTDQETLKLLYSARDSYAAYHKVTYTDGVPEAIIEAVAAVEAFDRTRAATDLLDTTGARAAVEGKKEVTPEMI